MFDGFEIDMLSLGDADCILVTQWTTGYGPFRVLIDGGSESDAEIAGEFLHSKNCTDLYAVVCTHPHNDHARGLIKLVADKSINITFAWMHDIRNHVSAEALRRASAGNSSQAEGVRQVVETTKELASAFASRKLAPQKPFAGATIAGCPYMTVLGPSLPFYRSVLEEFTKEEVPRFALPSSAAASALGSERPNPYRSALEGLLSQPAPKFPSPYGLTPPPRSALDLSTLLAGVLNKSSVKESPTTQPFNNTSVILGGIFNGNKLLFTADAGADALDRIPPDWKNLRWMQVPHHGSDGNLSQKNIERFCPKFANISARGDMSHPSRAIVNGLIKVGTQVFSTHSLNPGHLWFWIGNVPYRADYGPAIPLKGTGEPKSVIDWSKFV